MQRRLLLCLSLICACSSFAISKKTRLLLEQRDSLFAKIKREYVWKTQFEAIRDESVKKFYEEFESVTNYFVHNNTTSNLRKMDYHFEAPDFVITNEKEVDKFMHDIFYNGACKYPCLYEPHKYLTSKLWQTESDNIIKMYPQIVALDNQLEKKKYTELFMYVNHDKGFNTIGLLHDEWNQKFERAFKEKTVPPKEEIIAKFIAKRKADIINGSKRSYAATMANRKLQRDEQLRKDMEYYKSISAQYSANWYEGAWLGARNGRVEADYIIRITSSQLRILYHDRVVYSGSYSVRGGRIVFGNGGTIILDDSSNTIIYDGLSFVRNG